jgi:hypothetical protein
MGCKPLIGLAVLALMTGCASTRQMVPLPDQTKLIEDAGKSRIYVVRPSVVGGAISMRVSDGENEIGTTGAKGYLCWEREPGETTIRSHAENEDKLQLNTEAGAIYYIQQQIRVGVMVARNKLKLLSPQQGEDALLKCKPPNVKL